VASLSRADSWCNLRCSTQSAWAFALSVKVMVVVVDGEVQADLDDPAPKPVVEVKHFGGMKDAPSCSR